SDHGSQDRAPQAAAIPRSCTLRVRLMDSKSVGTIDQIEKGKATVNYGMFTTIVSVEQLEKV
ncbi:MAG: hypothetical protein ABJC32_05100, partial [Nonlabens ulvanivorans]|uniref:hypothetical protein n=1 Tax=Nonlabens ulvanivorans TaxID=906888 RepID=UPI003266C9BD